MANKSIIVDIPGYGPTEFQDENQVAEFYKKNVGNTPQSADAGVSGNFGQDLSDAPAAAGAQGRSLPGEISQIKDYANQFPPTSKQYKAYMQQYESARDDYLKLNPEDKPQKPVPPSQLASEADVKKYINDLVAANEANRVLKNVEDIKSKVNTGPFVSRVFDSAVPTYDKEGNLNAPGMIDSIISSVAPEKTKNMRLLDAALQGFSDYAFEKGGKQLTGTEKVSIFNRVPNRFDDDPQFKAVLDQSRDNLKGFVDNKVQVLKGLGYKEEDILKLLQSQMAPQAGGQAPDASFLQGMIQPKAQTGQPSIDQDEVAKALERKRAQKAAMGGIQ